MTEEKYREFVKLAEYSLRPHERAEAGDIVAHAWMATQNAKDVKNLDGYMACVIWNICRKPRSKRAVLHTKDLTCQIAFLHNPPCVAADQLARLLEAERETLIPEHFAGVRARLNGVRRKQLDEWIAMDCKAYDQFHQQRLMYLRRHLEKAARLPAGYLSNMNIGKTVRKAKTKAAGA